MAHANSLILWPCLVGFFFGQLFRITLFGFSFPIIDIGIALLALANFIYYLHSPQKIHNRSLLVFVIYSLINLLINLIRLHLSPLKPLFYFLRLSMLLSLFVFIPRQSNLFNHSRRPLFLILTSLVIFGFIQYLFWPDLTLFKFNQWDPHLFRLTSTLLDPTFTALIFLIFLILVYFSPQIPLRRLWLLIIYTALALTYSRSTLISLAITSAFISLKTPHKLLFVKTLILIIFTLFILPRTPGEGTNLARISTIKAKIINYQQAWKTFTPSPLFGIGYNTIGLVRGDSSPQSHANFGFDSSLMTILVTGGIFGTLFFIRGFTVIFTTGNLQYQSVLIAVLTHSLFANSLLYPWIMLLLAFVYRFKARSLS